MILKGFFKILNINFLTLAFNGLSTMSVTFVIETCAEWMSKFPYHAGRWTVEDGKKESAWFKCLNANQFTKDCKITQGCDKCDRLHLALLHKELGQLEK